MINETAWVIVNQNGEIWGHTLASSQEDAWDYANFGSLKQEYYEKCGIRAVQVRIEEVAPKAADEREVCECGHPATEHKTTVLVVQYCDDFDCDCKQYRPSQDAPTGETGA